MNTINNYKLAGLSWGEASYSKAVVTKTIITQPSGTIRQLTTMVSSKAPPITSDYIRKHSKAEIASEDMPSEASATSVSSKETRSRSRGSKEVKGLAVDIS